MGGGICYVKWYKRQEPNATTSINNKKYGRRNTVQNYAL